MTKKLTHYDILQVCREASPSVIRAAFKVLSQKWHPDKNLESDKTAQQHYQVIKQAFDILSNPILRQNYDQELKEAKSRGSLHSKELLHHYTEQEKETHISVIV